MGKLYQFIYKLQMAATEHTLEKLLINYAFKIKTIIFPFFSVLLNFVDFGFQRHISFLCMYLYTFIYFIFI